MKNVFFMFLILTLFIGIYSERVIWFQNTWEAGQGSLIESDSTGMMWTEMYNSKNQIFSSDNLTLAFPNLNSWNLVGTFPPSAALKTNRLIRVNDTLFAGTGNMGIVSYSSDNAATWTALDTLPYGQTDLEVLDVKYIDGVVYASGYWGGMNVGFMERSYDLQTWAADITQPEGADRVYKIMPVEENVFLIAAGNPDETTVSFDGIVFKTSNNFSTWEADTIGYVVVADIVRINDLTFIAAKDTFVDGACLAISSDKGDNWIPLANPAAWDIVTAIYYDEVNACLFVGDWAGQFAKVSGASWDTWDLLDNTDIIGAGSMIVEILRKNGDLYALTQLPGNLYYSDDDGATFGEIVIADTGIVSLVDLSPTSWGVGAITSAGGKIYYSSYYRDGWLESPIFDMDSTVAQNLLFNGNIPSRSAVKVKLRTGDSSDMTGAVDWASCPDLTTAGTPIDVSTISSVDVAHRYMQYYVELSTSQQRMDFTPTFYDIQVSGDFVFVDEIRNNEMDISYNRFSSGIFNVNIKNENKIEYVIYDLSGRKLKTGILNEGLNSVKLEIPNGKYIIKFNSRNYTNTGKLYIIK